MLKRLPTEGGNIVQFDEKITSHEEGVEGRSRGFGEDGQFGNDGRCVGRRRFAAALGEIDFLGFLQV